MKRLYRTLRFQLLFRSLAILALLLCFIGGTQYMFMTRTMYENQAISIQSYINSMDQSVWRSIKTLARSGNIGSSEFDLPRSDGCFYQSIIQDVCFIRRPARGAAPSFPKKCIRMR